MEVFEVFMYFMIISNYFLKMHMWNRMWNQLAEMARKIYRHRLQPLVDSFDQCASSSFLKALGRLLTDVVDTAVFELAKEVKNLR